jgi:glycosyltransferase involved in cell wall biosynthesis
MLNRRPDEARNEGRYGQDESNNTPHAIVGDADSKIYSEAQQDEPPPPAPVIFPTEGHRIAAEALGLEGDQLDLLVSLFHPSSYRRRSGLEETTGDLETFQHFIDHGIKANQTPGPFFDVAHCSEALAAQGIPVEEPILLSWLKAGHHSFIIPTPHFDRDYFLSANEDVAEAGINPFHHFLLHGHRAGRLPNPGMEPLESLILWQPEWSETPFSDFLSLFPKGHEYDLAGPDNLDVFRKLFQPDFYLAQLRQEMKRDLRLCLEHEKHDGTCEEMLEDPEEEIEKRLQKKMQETLPEEKALEHFICIGSRKGFRPTILFNETHYLHKLAERLGSTNDTLDPAHGSGGSGSDVELLPVADGCVPFWHWFCVGRTNRILPTPLFDEQGYIAAHKDLKTWKSWHFDHYSLYGIKEIHRTASAVFSASYYCSQRPKRASNPPLVDYVVEGDALGIRPAADISLAAFADAGDLKTTTRIERLATTLQRKLERLDSPAFKPLIEHAAGIEPMVLRPYGHRYFQWPPLKHSAIAIVELMAELRKSLQKTHYDTIVLIPHCRIAGSARVAGTLVSSLMALYPSESLLLVLTDLSEFQRPDWFSENIHILDLSAQVAKQELSARVTALLDLVRGLTPRRVINVNSRLAWDLFQTYGEQISTWTDLYAYLFTWDLDKYGNKGGYPIQFFYPSFDAYSGIFIDNAPLAREIVNRFAVSRALQKKIHLLYTAAEPTDVSYEKVFELRRQRGKRLRCFWVGRFDRQKRFDIVVEIARMLPQMEIVAWGKRVLEDFDMDWKSLPDNIKLQGIYNEFDELPARSFDFFLYTSEWDGLPTILIDIGSHGIATMGSRVGGTADLLSEKTAWPVDDVLNPAAYVAAIEAMCANPAEVGRRAASFRAHTMALCSAAKYRDTLKAVFEGEKHAAK